jgi:hypothetical protein
VLVLTKISSVTEEIRARISTHNPQAGRACSAAEVQSTHAGALCPQCCQQMALGRSLGMPLHLGAGVAPSQTTSIIIIMCSRARSSAPFAGQPGQAALPLRVL